MDLQLRNSKVVLCGATGLLGKTIALELAREGATIALLGRNTDALATLKTDVEANGSPSAITIECELDSETSTDQAIGSAIEALGGIDVFIFAAGAAQGGIFWEMDDVAWKSNLEIKLFGAIRALSGRHSPCLKKPRSVRNSRSQASRGRSSLGRAIRQPVLAA